MTEFVSKRKEIEKSSKQNVSGEARFSHFLDP